MATSSAEAGVVSKVVVFGVLASLGWAFAVRDWWALVLGLAATGLVAGGAGLLGRRLA